jgi:hypothetical protein
MQRIQKLLSDINAVTELEETLDWDFDATKDLLEIWRKEIPMVKSIPEFLKKDFMCFSLPKNLKHKKKEVKAWISKYWVVT